MKALDILKGATIIDVRSISNKDLEEALGWEDYQHTAIEIVLSNGIVISASQDPEGNGPGCFFVDGAHTGRLYIEGEDREKGEVKLV